MPLQTNHRLDIDGVSQELRVVRFHGTEGLSELFELDIVFASEDNALAFDDVVGKKALLTFAAPTEDQPRWVHGLVARLEVLDFGKKLSSYRITVVPRVWKLQHRRDNRIFQDLTAPQVIKKVLDGAGLASGDDYRIDLQGTYVKRDYCVQYRESDWEFVCRLLEEEGVEFFFEHAEDKHVLVLNDTSANHNPIPDPTLAFRPAQGALGGHVDQATFVTRFNVTQEIRAGKVTLRDWSFEKPGLLLEGTRTAKEHTDLELYDYPGEYNTPADGGALSKIRVEEQQTPRLTGHGESSCSRMTPGMLFTLEEHPREAFNRQYLLTRVEHRGIDPSMGGGRSEEGEYANRFEVIASDVPFRPARVTRRPVIRGVQTAIVVGPAGEEIYTDAHGRVKVQFHWDRLGKKDDKSSCWIRVSQLWAGEAWGAMFIPRINQEVVVSFEEGDPDRPLIVGRLYHGTNVPPYALPGEKTKSTIKSNSSPGGEGSNELRFEDKKGSEEIYLHAQKDTTIKTENDKNQITGHDETLTVKNDRTKTVEHDQTETVKNDNTLLVEHDQKETIKNDETLVVEHDRSVTVDHDHTELVHGNQSSHVGKDQTVKVDGKQTETIAKDHAFTVQAKQTVDVSDDVTHTYGAKMTLSVGDDQSAEISGTRTLKVTKDVSETFDAKYTLAVTGDAAEEYKAKRTVKVTDTFTIECGQSKLTMKSDGTIKMEGMSFELKCSGGAVKINGLQIEVKADTTIKVEAGAKMDLKGAMVDLNGSGMVKIGAPSIGAG